MNEPDNSSPGNESVHRVSGNDLPDLTIYGYQVSERLSQCKDLGRITYLARDLQHVGRTSEKEHRLVVIKEWRIPDLEKSKLSESQTPSLDYANYLPEIERLQQLDLPSIPRYLTSFSTPTGFCVVREYQSGVSLAELGTLPASDIKLVADAVLKILKYLHQLAPVVIHQNIKPENIIVNTETELAIYLIDFGLHPQGDASTGTPGFIPPEQLFNLELTPTSDIYSLGISLICLLTGTSTGRAQSLLDNNYRPQFKHLLPANTDPKMIMWLETMIEPNRYQRFINPDSFGDTAQQRVPHHKTKSFPKHVPVDIEFDFAESTPKIKWIRWTIAISVLLGLCLLAIQFFFPASEELSPAQIAKNQSIAEKAEFEASDRGRLVKEKRCASCSLDRQSFAKAELTGLNVPQSSFIGTNFSGANLTLAIFRDADLSGANLSKATLHQAAFYGAKLIGTNLAGADLRDAKLVYAKLKGSSLKNVNLARADLKFAEFQQADLTNANLTGADLSNADMSYANLTGVPLTGAKLDGVIFTGAKMPNGSIHP
ncbi:pentapeptide repeat-containing protein [Chamaesiphon sp. VAR_48_metabat_135_sub]|uniref:pentapeptide repeat-containing protein n=1 Tax=Chamaesiphon sp. VAR_48_metabat_135_sub TaxID=2964699 RepID=UPI00286A1A0B|nr:pentapeptide repeat-containing protein [Chamaesiphon sp. VAR_48_metabat_135_sub]